MNHRLATLLCLTFVMSCTAAAAQTQPSPRLSDQEPFDRITLNEENLGAVIKVEPLELPGRKVPAMPDPESALRVKLYAQPDKTYEIQWKHIVKVELFENLLLAEAQQFISEDKLDDAYDALQFLKQNFPKADGLDALVQSYLYTSAGRMYQQQRWSEALALVEELYRVNPEYPTDVFGRVLEKLVASYVDKPDFRSARLLLA